jgi:hypothetical protein
MGEEPTVDNKGGQEANRAAHQLAPPASTALQDRVAANPVVQEAQRLFRARIVSVRLLGSDEDSWELSGRTRKITQQPLWPTLPESGPGTP